LIKLYVPLEAVPKRQHLFPLLKPFEKGEGFTDATRIALYGISEKEVSFVTTLEAADYVVLPMSWNYYLARQEMAEVEEVILDGQAADKKVLSFMTGDFGVKIPDYNNIIVFRNSGDRSKLPATHVGMPAFIADPLPRIFKTDALLVRPYAEMPTIGFCGQADDSIGTRIKELFKTAYRNVISLLGIDARDRQPLIATSFLRASILQRFEKASGVQTNFIYRKKYRAGATTKALRQQTTLAFYENMKASDYIVCVRGAGNFSVRFYEALAMGRIPVFVNTDCLLPLAETIDWKKHVVWVEYAQRHEVAEKVLTFHNALSASEFEYLQEANRKLYQEKLSLGGFFKEFLQEKP